MSSIYEGGDSFMSSQTTLSYPYDANISPAQYGHTPRLSHPDQSLSQNSLTPFWTPSVAETVAHHSSQAFPYSTSRESSQETTTSAVPPAHLPPWYQDARPAGRPGEGRSKWPAIDMPTLPQRFTLSTRTDAFSPQVPARPWSPSGSSATSSSSGSAPGSHYASSLFPALVPLFSSQLPPQRYVVAVPPSPSSMSESFYRTPYTGTNSTVPLPLASASRYHLHHSTSLQSGPEDPYAGNEAKQHSSPEIERSHFYASQHPPLSSQYIPTSAQSVQLPHGRYHALSSSQYAPPASPEIERFSCDKCDMIFSRAADHKRHYESQHSIRPYLHHCRFCNQEFSRADSLKRHIKNGCEKDPTFQPK